MITKQDILARCPCGECVLHGRDPQGSDNWCNHKTDFGNNGLCEELKAEVRSAVERGVLDTDAYYVAERDDVIENESGVDFKVDFSAKKYWKVPFIFGDGSPKGYADETELWEDL